MVTNQSAAALPPTTGPRGIIGDAIRYWEPRRILYNLALVAVAAFVVVRTWPHFRPAFKLGNIPRVAILAALANGCYCAAYVVELIAGEAVSREVWRRWRWILFVAGTLFAMFIALYWIEDEIYPDFP